MTLKRGVCTVDLGYDVLDGDCSDEGSRGAQYTSYVFDGRCRKAGGRPSMAQWARQVRQRDVCESFVATLECELIRRRSLPESAVSEELSEMDGVEAVVSDSSSATMEAWRIDRRPCAVLVDERGIVVGRSLYVTEEALELLVDPLLSDEPTPVDMLGLEWG